MISWERKLDEMKTNLLFTKADTVRYWRIFWRYHNSKMSTERYTRLLAEKRVLIAKMMAEIEAHENNRPKPSYKSPQKRTDKISEWEKKVFDAKELYRVTVEEMKQIDTAKLQNLDKSRMDLMLTKASYDSINVLHTEAVLELSKN